MADVWFTFPYRDRSFKKYQIQVYRIEHNPGGLDGDRIQVNISVDNESVRFFVNFSRTWITTVTKGLKNFEAILGTNESSALLYHFVQDIIFGKDVKELNGKIFSFDVGGEFAKNVIQHQNDMLDFERDPKKLAQKNRFARELVLRTIYPLYSSKGAIGSGALKLECHYESQTIENAIDSLCSIGFLEKVERNSIKMTHKGMAFVEENYLLSPFSNKFFLIAACRDDIYCLIEKVYRPVVEELNFTLVFQEKTEPKDTIHEDIWENVKGCKLIICDLTHSRPNCFIEFGYALGLDRPMICVVEESEGKDLEGRLKVPFDCNNKSFSFWKKEWVDKPEKYKKAIAEFRDKLKDRIQQKLAILEAQSEI